MWANSISFYGLKKALRARSHRFSQAILAFGFMDLQVYQSMFIFHWAKTHIFLLVYVDDIIVTGTCPHHILALIQQLQQEEFVVKTWGPLHFFCYPIYKRQHWHSFTPIQVYHRTPSLSTYDWCQTLLNSCCVYFEAKIT